MNDPFLPRAGSVLSADIAVPEHEREVSFHSRVLGTGEPPLWREDLMNSLGMPIVGLGARSPEYAELPLQWMPHIMVADVAASAMAAVELGGKELMHGRDDDGNSQWAVLLDPGGAAFGVIPVASADEIPTPEGASSDDLARTGRISWLELTVPDASATRDFYARVAGWSAQEVEVEDAGERYADFHMLTGDGVPMAGIRHARGELSKLPRVWILSLPVGDLGESLRRVREEGGEVVLETHGGDGQATAAVIQDPVGVFLSLVPG